MGKRKKQHFTMHTNQKQQHIPNFTMNMNGYTPSDLLS